MTDWLALQSNAWLGPVWGPALYETGINLAFIAAIVAPLMGAVAARLSDFVVITSDNPRTEDPGRILDEIKRGLAPALEPGAPQRAATPWVAEIDRRRAIEQAVRNARPGDLVVIAGKGHEKYQIIGDRTLAFDDVEVAQAALAERRGARRM